MTRRLDWLALGTLLVVATASAAAAEDAAAPRPGALRAHIDPATGKFTTPPPGTAVTALPEALETSGEGLVEEPGTSPAGGVTVNLRGRFRSMATATVGADGKVSTHCEPAGQR